MRFIQSKNAYELVDHPKHYGGRRNLYEAIKVIEAWGLDRNFYLGQVIRYIARAGKKPENTITTDLKKANWYLNRQIDVLEGKEEAKFDKVVYISPPFGNDAENYQEISLLMEKMIIRHPDILFVSPVHTYGFLYEKLDYQTGIDLCLGLLRTCDEMWVFGDWQSSKGCTMEVEYCNGNNITCHFLSKVL